MEHQYSWGAEKNKRPQYSFCQVFRVVFFFQPPTYVSLSFKAEVEV